MLNVLWSLFLIAASVIATVLLIAWRRPDRMHIERRAVIPAAPEAIFAQLVDLKAWDSWSPWAKRDPKALNTYRGPAAGVGAVHRWEGNNDVGTGEMEIVEVVPGSRVVMDLRFEKPFVGTNRAEFTLIPVANGTEVRWIMTGPAPLMSRVMDLAMNMDTMIGRDFEAGLAALGQVSAPTR